MWSVLLTLVEQYASSYQALISPIKLLTLYLNTELEKNIIAQLVTPNVNVSAIKTPTVARLSCAKENHREPLDLQISEQLVNIPAALFSPCTPLYGDNCSIRDRIVQAQQMQALFIPSIDVSALYQSLRIVQP